MSPEAPKQAIGLTDSRVQEAIERLRRGDGTAKQELLVHAQKQRSPPRAVLVCSTARCRFAGLRSFPMRPPEESPRRVRRRPTAASVGYSPSRDPSAA